MTPPASVYSITEPVMSGSVRLVVATYAKTAEALRGEILKVSKWANVRAWLTVRALRSNIRGTFDL